MGTEQRIQCAHPLFLGVPCGAIIFQQHTEFLQSRCDFGELRFVSWDGSRINEISDFNCVDCHIILGSSISDPKQAPKVAPCS